MIFTKLFETYPDFIWFDGRLSIQYEPKQLARIALISEDYYKVIGYKFIWPLDSVSIDKAKQFIDKVHQLGKPVRLWASPDKPAAWEQFMQWGVDFINTDKIKELSDFSNISIITINKMQKVLKNNKNYIFSRLK